MSMTVKQYTVQTVDIDLSILACCNDLLVIIVLCVASRIVVPGGGSER